MQTADKLDTIYTLEHLQDTQKSVKDMSGMERWLYAIMPENLRDGGSRAERAQIARNTLEVSSLLNDTMTEFMAQLKGIVNEDVLRQDIQLRMEDGVLRVYISTDGREAEPFDMPLKVRRPNIQGYSIVGKGGGSDANESSVRCLSGKVVQE
jgi:hypothetical protein